MTASTWSVSRVCSQGLRVLSSPLQGTVPCREQITDMACRYCSALSRGRVTTIVSCNMSGTMLFFYL